MEFSEMMSNACSCFQVLADAFVELVNQALGVIEVIKDIVKDAVEEVAALREKPDHPIIMVILGRSTGLRSETVTRTLIPL